MTTIRSTGLCALLLIAGLLPALPSRAQQACPERPYWPTAAWRSRVDQVATQKAAAIEALEAYAFKLEGEDAERKGVRTDAVLIVQGGEIVYERYARGWQAHNRHIAWSVTKSINGALLGRAVALGAVNPADSICQYLPTTREDNCDITLQNLVEFGSGLDWSEGYENDPVQESSVINMQWGPGRKDMAGFVFDHEAAYAPGTRFHYSSGDSTSLAGVLHAALKPVHGEDWPWPLLFDRIGMTHTTFERDQKGVPVANGMLFATPRDLARIAYLYLADGCWDGERLLPPGWVQQSVTVSELFKGQHNHEEDTPCGMSWWLNRPVPEKSLAKPWPDLPDDTFRADGHWGQEILVIPSADVVVVRTGDDRDSTFDVNTFGALALAVAR